MHLYALINLTTNMCRAERRVEDVAHVMDELDVNTSEETMFVYLTGTMS